RCPRSRRHLDSKCPVIISVNHLTYIRKAQEVFTPSYFMSPRSLNSPSAGSKARPALAPDPYISFQPRLLTPRTKPGEYHPRTRARLVRPMAKAKEDQTKHFRPECSLTSTSPAKSTGTRRAARQTRLGQRDQLKYIYAYIR